MRVIKLDGSEWKTPIDFAQPLFDAIEQGYPHGLSVNAFIDSMIYRGMGGIEPPYTIRIVNLVGTPQEVRDYISMHIQAIRDARQERAEMYGVDVEVSISAPELSR